MPRNLHTPLLCVGLTWLALASPTGASMSSGTPVVTPAAGEASAALQDCRPALVQNDRSATFAGEMTALAGSTRMAIRVDLLERAEGTQAFHAVTAPGLSVWRRSAADVQVYRYVKQVVNLPAPDAYRAVLEFRWLDARGHVIRQLRRRTPVCEQPDERPLLRVGRVTMSSTPGSTEATYAILVRNDGHGAVGPFAVSLSVGAAQQPLVKVSGMAASSRFEVDTTAPRCAPGSAIRVVLDPARIIDEAPGGGRPRVIACPPATPGNGANAPAPAPGGGP